MNCDFCKPWADGQCDFGCRCVECAEPEGGYWFNANPYPPPEPWYSPECGCDDCRETELEELRIERYHIGGCHEWERP